MTSKTITPSTSPTSSATPNPIISSSTYAPKWHLGLTGVTVSLFISESSDPMSAVEGFPAWNLEDLTFGGWQGEFTQELVIDAPKFNESIFAHIFIAQDGFLPREFKEEGDKVLLLSRQLNYYLPRKKAKRTKSLLDKKEEEGETDIEVVEDEDTSYGSYWWPNATIQLVADQNPMPRKNVPVINKSELSPFLYLLVVKLVDEGNSYLPLVYFNDFWMMQDNLQMINETTPKLNLSLSFSEIPMWYEHCPLTSKGKCKCMRNSQSR
jgi:hypothetical protein